ncbi:MAG TPA: YtxH domain-containing protein [Thermodesulfovibrionales bacterium]|nr:YtxH domain-containing protein [Thermodesulfovibrionales bacterium]
MRHEDEGYSAGSVLLSFLLGGMVGAGVALLLAPKSGKETREQIKELAEDVRGKTGEYVEQVKGKMTASLDKGKDFFEEKKSIITRAVEAGKEAYEKEKERLTKEPNA